MNRKQAIKEAREYLMFNKDEQKALDILKTVYPVHRQAKNRLKKLLNELHPKDNDWKQARELVKTPPESWGWLEVPNSVIEKYFMVLNQNEKRSKKL
jgi:hypothetical protein